MTYKIYKAEEYHGRDIHYIGQEVLFCDKCGYVGTYKNRRELEAAKIEHSENHYIAEEIK